MGMWVDVSPWRIVNGSGQSKAVANGSSATFSNALGKTTGATNAVAFAIRLAPATTPYIALVTVTAAGTAATASTDYPIASTDPPQVIACAAGDQVSVYGVGATGTAYLVELTH